MGCIEGRLVIQKLFCAIKQIIAGKTIRLHGIIDAANSSAGLLLNEIEYLLAHITCIMLTGQDAATNFDC